MGLQGIKGPSYRLVHGNAKEILNMKKEAMSRSKGLSHDIFPALQPQYHSWFKTYGKIFLQWVGTEAQLVVMEPELCKEILINKDKVYLQVKMHGFGKKLLGNGIGNSEGERELFKTSDEVEAEKLEKEIRKTILEIVKKRENKAVAQQDELNFGGDFLGLLLKDHHVDSNDRYRFTIDDIIDQCKALYFAGQETTNGSLSWTVFLLALHQDWQEEARKEVLQLFGKQNPNIDGISRLKTMNMIINESLRLYPPVTQLIKRTEREVRLGKLIVPADIDLVIPIVALHHDTQIWGQDAGLFKPDRFSEGVAKATKNNMAAFIPFGIGPRICAGFNFATTEIKIALSMILRRYTFTLSPGYVHSPLHFLTLRPQNGLQGFHCDTLQVDQTRELMLEIVNESLIFETGEEVEAKKLEKEIRDTILEIVKERENKAQQDEHLGGLGGVGMNMIINESLRLYPPVIQLVNRTGRKVRLGKLIIPADIDLVYGI
ncbi:PREDICTED: secologanin synthase-like [Fragaria vesca subsp. vesca]